MVKWGRGKVGEGKIPGLSSIGLPSDQKIFYICCILFFTTILYYEYVNLIIIDDNCFVSGYKYINLIITVSYFFTTTIKISIFFFYFFIFKIFFHRNASVRIRTALPLEQSPQPSTPPTSGRNFKLVVPSSESVISPPLI